MYVRIADAAVHRRPLGFEVEKAVAVAVCCGVSVFGLRGSGFGGLTALVLAFTAGGLSSAVGVDRLLYIVWWSLMWGFYQYRVEAALISGASSPLCCLLVAVVDCMHVD